MNASAQLPITFVLLALAICAVWLPKIRLGTQLSLELWPMLYITAILSGLYFGHLKWPALIAISLLALAAYFAESEQARKAIRVIGGVVTAVTALALAFHILPGFSNPILIENARLSADAAPYTQYANFDKASAGLLILAFLCSRAVSWGEWKKMLCRSYSTILATSAVVILLSYLVGYVRVSPKLPVFTIIFLVVNLLFVCVAEETFFRGFLQDRLARYLQGRQVAGAGTIAVVACALLYGLVHFAGGPVYVLLASVAGLGYGYAYWRTQRVEAPILAHFVLNAVHFIGFTYPTLA